MEFEQSHVDLSSTFGSNEDQLDMDAFATDALVVNYDPF